MVSNIRRFSCRALGILLAAALLLGFAAPAFAASGYDRPGQKLAALTFDDGPGPYSNQILDVLKKHGAKATFFMNGYRIEKYPDQVRRMAAEGHQIANHTYDHPQLTKISDDKIRWEVDSTARLLTRVTGLSGTGDGGFYLRAPYGDVNAHVSSIVGVPMVQWSVDSQDWKYQSASRLVSYVGSTLSNGDIVLMHESHKSTAQGLDALLDVLDERGFELVTVEELLWRRGIEAKPGTTYASAKDTGVDRCPRALWFDESRPDTHWAHEAIDYVLSAGLMARNDAGEFLPNFPLARRTFASALWRMYGEGTQVEITDVFLDVPPDDPDAAAVAWARQSGVMAGVSPRYFDPDRPMTRQELAVVLARCARLAGCAAEDETFPPPDYADRDQIAPWALDAVALCAQLGLLQGADGRFLPENTVTRAMGAAVLERLSRLAPAQEEEPEAEPETEPGTETEGSHDEI